MGVTVRTQEIDEAIINGLSDGIPLRQLCRTHEIGKSTVYRWMEEDANFAGQVARARELGFEQLAEECLAIIDEEPERVITVSGEDRSESRIDSASVQRAKNRAELRLKLLACWDPKRYGNKQLIGSDPENPLPTGFHVNLHPKPTNDDPTG